MHKEAETTLQRFLATLDDTPRRTKWMSVLQELQAESALVQSIVDEIQNIPETPRKAAQPTSPPRQLGMAAGPAGGQREVAVDGGGGAAAGGGGGGGKFHSLKDALEEDGGNANGSAAAAAHASPEPVRYGGGREPNGPSPQREAQWEVRQQAPRAAPGGVAFTAGEDSSVIGMGGLHGDPEAWMPPEPIVRPPRRREAPGWAHAGAGGGGGGGGGGGDGAGDIVSVRVPLLFRRALTWSPSCCTLHVCTLHACSSSLERTAHRTAHRTARATLHVHSAPT